jgi:hypothetical protein
MPTDDPEKTPAEQAVEQALDLLVYAPIGLLFEGASLLPELVAKGKNQVAVARMFGQMAVQQAGKEATKAVGRLQDQAAGVIDFLGDSVTPLGSDEPTATAPAARATVPKAATPPKKATGTKAPAAKAVDVGTLAIPDYDGLSASHVVNRLAGLTAKELENVRLYELANRGRKTILSKISQLQG